MLFSSPSHLDVAKISALRPTQLTVGLLEVAEKRQEWSRLEGKERREFLEGHVVPTVLGPKGHRYIIDHHHLGLALLEEGHKHIWATQVQDFSHLEEGEFWSVMDHHSFVHPYDAEGQRVEFQQIPRSLKQLIDDPFRSLAGEVRKRGGIAKVPQPFSEFIWADFFRRRIPGKLLKKDFEAAVQMGIGLASTAAALHLPGNEVPTSQ